MATKEKPKQSILKKIKWTLQHLDGIWSVPLAFFAFYFVGLGITSLFGYGTGFYDPAFIQPLFLAGAVVIGATNFGILGLYFTVRGLYRYFYGRRDEKTGKIVNDSKEDWVNIPAWLRYVFAFFSLFFFVVAIIVVYLKMV